MGAGASTGAAVTLSAEDVGKWSKEEVGEQIASFGEAFEGYKAIVIKEGIDGATLLDVDDEDLEAYGVTKRPHRKRILKNQQPGEIRTTNLIRRAAPRTGPWRRRHHRTESWARCRR